MLDHVEMENNCAVDSEHGWMIISPKERLLIELHRRISERDQQQLLRLTSGLAILEQEQASI
ncbi:MULTISPECIES: hypothetical protein [Pseudomonas syringae group]|uniref:Uncharacterized protein n=1 Tax=Pseudomonas syringae pv. spinaceae TaxID=264459 RepID=A0A0Q0J9C1_PSESX|nr:MULTISPECIES: hypothetical protein [Pseudomonas syringae group]KPZ10704.1 Uncharacterized protein ALO94_03024 [Pseudomonas syringae pv. spinaceae]MCF5747131.1 hypothetical protein [Pseudomonas tremae]QQN27111.1 hypothetical protein JHZ65_26615 [Pseudomonas syringae pv. maculicola]RMO77547.1 hypothetical protein ALQ34_102996 [Pseudomonas syringae pv. maculicola]RMT26503.1 hypothetical protein ALP50_102750 [Pseudomonas syringae pv. spinaceae]